MPISFAPRVCFQIKQNREETFQEAGALSDSSGGRASQLSLEKELQRAFNPDGLPGSCQSDLKRLGPGAPFLVFPPLYLGPSWGSAHLSV